MPIFQPKKGLFLPKNQITEHFFGAFFGENCKKQRKIHSAHKNEFIK